MQLKISDMMNEFLPEEDMMPKTLEQVTYDEERVKQLVRTRLTKETPMPRGQRKRRMSFSRIIAAAAIFCLCAGTATAAAVHFEWDRHLANFLQPTDKQAEQLTPAGAMVEQSVTDNGVTVTIKQVLGDKYSVYILGDIVAPEGTILDDSFSFDTNHLRIDSDDPYHLGYGFDVMDDDVADNKLSFVYDLTASQALTDSTAHLELADLRYYDVALGDYQTLIEGNWDFSWSMAYTDISQTDTTKISDAVLGDGNEITEINLSPLSLSLLIDGPIAKSMELDEAYEVDMDAAAADLSGEMVTLIEDDPDEDEEASAIDIALLDHLAFIQADGSEIAIPWHTAGCTNENGAGFLVTYHFGKIIDTENIVGLRIGEYIHNF